MTKPTAKELNEITSKIIGAAIDIHKTFGPGLLEHAYNACLSQDLMRAHLKVERQKALPLMYQGVRINCAYRADIVVEGKVLIEVKAVEAPNPTFRRQVYTYLRLGDYRVGLLLNFGAPTMLEGIERIVNDFPHE